MVDLDLLTDSFEDTISEFKRAEHSIYVSLKYTRTKDIIEGIFDRFISTFDKLLDVLLIMKGLEDYEPSKKIELVKEYYKGDAVVDDLLKYFNFIKAIKRGKKYVRDQFRRHVKVVVEVAPNYVYVADVDSVVENYKMIHGFIEQIHYRISHQFFSGSEE